MQARVSVRCISTFVIIFMMCPKRSILIGDQQEYYHAVRRSSNLKYSDNMLPVLRQDDEPAGGVNIDEENVPGLELTDEEIRKFKLWDKGMVPYYIDALSFSDKVLRDRIRWFLNAVNSLTSLNFVELPRPPQDDETRWVFFVNRRSRLGCADHSTKNFKLHGVQPVSLGYDCMNTGGEMAEAVLAIAGVPPQHNAPNRDDYIEILEDNIIPDKQHLFTKLNEDDWLFENVSYDFTSAGHFHPHKHSANGRATIKIKSDGTGNITPLKCGGLSNKDILKINMLYNYIVKVKKGKNTESQCSRLFLRGKKKKRPKKKGKQPGKFPTIKPPTSKSTTKRRSNNSYQSDLPDLDNDLFTITPKEEDGEGEEVELKKWMFTVPTMTFKFPKEWDFLYQTTTYKHPKLNDGITNLNFGDFRQTPPVPGLKKKKDKGKYMLLPPITIPPPSGWDLLYKPTTFKHPKLNDGISNLNFGDFRQTPPVPGRPFKHPMFNTGISNLNFGDFRQTPPVPGRPFKHPMFNSGISNLNFGDFRQTPPVPGRPFKHPMFNNGISNLNFGDFRQTPPVPGRPLRQPVRSKLSILRPEKTPSNTGFIHDSAENNLSKKIEK